MRKFYFDTSVLLPVLIQEHENHETCKKLLQDALRDGSALTSATHAYAELYRHLTKNRAPYNLLPEEAKLAVVDNLGKLLEIVAMDKADYEKAIARCVKLGLTGAVIYDALHLEAALKAGAEILYSDNLRDFTRLVTKDDSIKLEGVRIK
jgi:predicted nucleic acid-binding protein